MILVLYLVHGRLHPVAGYVPPQITLWERGLHLPNRGVVLEKNVVHLYCSTRPNEKLSLARPWLRQRGHVEGLLLQWLAVARAGDLPAIYLSRYFKLWGLFCFDIRNRHGVVRHLLGCAKDSPKVFVKIHRESHSGE